MKELKYKELHDAATKIQSAWRSYVQRMHFIQVKDRVLRNIVKIQRHFRVWARIRIRARKQLQRKARAQVVIARFTRGMLVRKKLKSFMRQKIDYQLDKFSQLREKAFDDVVRKAAITLQTKARERREAKRQKVRMCFFYCAMKIAREYIKSRKPKASLPRYMQNLKREKFISAVHMQTVVSSLAHSAATNLRSKHAKSNINIVETKKHFEGSAVRKSIHKKGVKGPKNGANILFTVTEEDKKKRGSDEKGDNLEADPSYQWERW